MSKRNGPTRIPLFGSRIPISGQAPLEAPRPKPLGATNAPEEIPRQVIGKKIYVAEKEGILRYIGKVHFAEGVWCGIEFPTACGKNNGCVRGVRYFACGESCGLMAPLSKVSFFSNIEYEKHEDPVSGPHSMLFGVKETSVPKDNENVRREEHTKRRGEEVVSANKVLIRSDTYESLNGDGKRYIPKFSSKIYKRSETFDKSEQNQKTKKLAVQKTCGLEGLSYLNQNNFPDIVNSSRIQSSTDVDTEVSSINTNAANIDTGNSEELKNSPVISIQTSSPVYKGGGDTLCDGIKGASTDSFNVTGTPIYYSTPHRLLVLDIEKSPQRRIRPTLSFGSSLEDAVSKRDSLEYEESLGILTPEQMTDGTSFVASRTPSSENIGSLPEDLQHIIGKFQLEGRSPLDLPSPNFVDASAKDTSLGLIDERIISNFPLVPDTAMNLELPLDSIDNRSGNYLTARLEQTPSPEDLPLDPTPTIEIECKVEPTKSKPVCNFINSITSITSLDTGYQGDGEMSRPGSRGPDHSPLTRRPLIRPLPRRHEPMTDSDFYTESDADILEEQPVRGDRKARVIDGTLYALDAQTAAEIYVNNRENMDSSGIFTDIEGNTLSSADNENPDVSPSPSDASSKTISNDSQNHALLQKTTTKKDLQYIECSKSDTPKRKSVASSASATSSPASIRSPKHIPKEDQSKKFKTPKRIAVSKVKAILESSPLPNTKETNRNSNKKPVGRWDAVMNKISKNQVERTNLKEVKSKIVSNFSPINSASSPQKTTVSRLRRPRPRNDVSTTKNTAAESLNSSASDLSAASPVKRIGSAKKRADVVRVTQVLTAAQLSPRSIHKNNVLAENKKNVATNVGANENKFTPKKNLVTKEKKTAPPAITAKDGGKATVKGGRVSPGARPPQLNRVPVVPLPKTIEALTVLLQHLVFNLDAFQTPFLKRELEKSKQVAEKAQLAYRQLEGSFELLRIDQRNAMDEEREKLQNDVAEMVKRHRSDLAELSEQHSQSVNLLLLEQQELEQSHKEQLIKLRSEYTKLQKSHEQSLEILREENDSIREEIDERNIQIEKLKQFRQESDKLEKDYKAKEVKYKEQVNYLTEEIERLREDNHRMMGYAIENKEDKLQIVIAEVESLRAVLELKQNEVAELRKALAQSNQKADLLPSTIEKVSSLTARCEDLQSQLELKTQYESQLISDNKRLQQSLKDEFNHSNRLLHHNEELQWKLCQNKEVVNRVLEQAEETVLSRSLVTASFNERHSTTPRQVERAASFRERSLSSKSMNSPENSNYYRCNRSKNSYDFETDDISPPSSPKVKGVVEKSDSVSYVLEMEESPQIIADRIVRRSFRNPTPPKNTPLKSPVNKRARMKVNPITGSASTSSIMSTLVKMNNESRVRSISVQNSDNEVSSSHSDEVFIWNVPSSTPFKTYANGAEHNLDLYYNEDEDIKLPTLPSEIGRHNAEALPVPQHLAGDVMVLESNSEDESTASSSSGNL